MPQWRKTKLHLSKGVRVPKWMKYLCSVEIGYERFKGRRIRFIMFRRADAVFGRGGSIWLSLPELRYTMKYFPNTLQILNGRGRVVDRNFFLCPRCFLLSGKMDGEVTQVEGRPSCVNGKFACTNDGCTERWEREW